MTTTVIAALALTAGLLTAGCRVAAPRALAPGSALVLYDAVCERDLDPMPGSGDPALDWGYSVLLRWRDSTVLFDAGNDVDVFRRNAAALGVDLGEVDVAVVSHNHNDHTAGIAHLLDVNPDVALYVPADPWFGRRPEQPGGLDVPREPAPGDARLRYWRGGPPARRGWGARWPHADWEPVGESREVAPGVTLVTTEARRWGYFDVDPAGSRTDRPLPELTLVLRGPRGLVAVTGCSHSGIVEIVEAVRARFPDEPIRLVMGGFHLLDQTDDAVRAIARRLRELGVERVAPGHCTGEGAFKVFQQEFGERWTYAGLGTRLDLDAGR